MLTLFRRKKFDKDLRRMERRGKPNAKLWDIVELLLKEESLAAKHQNHKLTGDWEGFWECHIEPDCLLIYALDHDTLTLTRTGTHSDLF